MEELIQKLIKRMDEMDKRLIELENKKGIKSSKNVIKMPKQKDDLNLLKKFTSKNKLRETNFNSAITGVGFIKTTDNANTLIIENEEYYNGKELFDISGSIFLKSKGDIDEYILPSYPESDKIANVKLNKEIIESIFKAMEYGNCKNNLCIYGVYLKSQDNILDVVGTDSYRMYSNTFNVKSDNFEVLLDYELVKNIKSDYTKFGDIVDLEVNSKFVKLKYSNRAIYYKTLGMSYPNYKNIIKSAEYDTYREIQQNLKELYEYSKNNNPKHGVIFDFGNGKALTSDTTIPLFATGNYEGKICLNIKLLMSVLDIDKKLYIKDSSSLVYTRKGNEISLLMPMAIRD